MICQTCNKQFSTRIKINNKWYRGGNNRNNCYNCKPIKPHINKIINNSEKICTKCNKQMPLKNFYINSNTNKPKTFCKNCYNKSVASIRIPRRIDNKKKAIEYKGGCCEKCGYKKFYGALEFHHVNPKHKTGDMSINRWQNYTFNKWKKELDKCILVCANCHREIHHENHLKILKLR